MVTKRRFIEFHGTNFVYQRMMVDLALGTLKILIKLSLQSRHGDYLMNQRAFLLKSSRVDIMRQVVSSYVVKVTILLMLGTLSC